VRQVTFLTTLFEAASIAIAIQDDWLQRCRALHEGIHWVPTDPDLPPLASLLPLLRTMPLRQWGFVWHVDMPVWKEELFRELAHAAETAADDVEALLPTWKERGGHPLVLAPRAAVSLAQLDPQQDRLDHWLRARHVTRVAVQDPVIHENWNQAEPSG